MSSATRAYRAVTSAAAIFFTFSAVSASSQTFQVIHSFTGSGDGYAPSAGVTVDRAGNLYGTTSQSTGPGTVFEMKRKNGAWLFNTLFEFTDIVNGRVPMGRPVFGPGGALYGTNSAGGAGNCTPRQYCGTVYSLRASQSICRTVNCPWTATLVTSFDGTNGALPYYVDPVFDSAGNLYGTTAQGGAFGDGNVFQLTRSADGEWTATSIHDFGPNPPDQSDPLSGVTLDAAGNIYGTTAGHGFGIVYRLTPSGSGWTETVLYSFQDGADESSPIGGLVFDHAGNLYGTTSNAGVNGGGTVFQLSTSGGGWALRTLYSFSSDIFNSGPYDTLLIDAAGNLYGTTYRCGAFGYGNVFELSPGPLHWTYDRPP